MPKPEDLIAMTYVTPWGHHIGKDGARAVCAFLEAQGYAVVPIKPSERMLEELARIGDGPEISGAECWGYMLAAAATA
jgi:hypothetical protein